MQENNFEKQVQQKTNELKLKPSEEVWQKVSAIIAKEKSDRRIFALVFLLLLFISSTVFTIWHYSSNKKSGKEISIKSDLAKSTITAPSVADNNNRRDNGTENHPSDKKENAEKSNATSKTITVKNLSSQQLSIQQKPKVYTPVSVKNPVISNVNAYAKNEHDHISSGNKLSYKNKSKLNLSIQNGDAGDLVNTQTDSDETNKKDIVTLIPEVKDEVHQKQLSDTVSTVKVIEKSSAKDSAVLANQVTPSPNTAEKKSIQKAQKNKWKVGVNFSFGVSATRDSYLGIVGLGGGDESKNLAADYAVQQPGNNSGGQPAAVIYTPSQIKAGYGFVLGVFAQKDISNKINFLVGVNYKTYSSSFLIGNRVDSGAASNLNSSYYYRSGTQNRYKNHFHFIELPVALQYRLSGQSKLPIYLTAGISVARLISSNALQFDIQTGAYYKENAAFNKSLANMSAGLLFSLSGNAKNPFMLGPDINFSLNKMAGSGLYASRHYSYFGIQLQKTFGKK